MRVQFERMARRMAIATVAVSTPVLAAMPTAAHAVSPTLFITEVAPWGSGNAPYLADWFEVTNTGGSAVNITGWKMDDNSNSFAASVPLSGVTSIGAGQTVVFVETAAAATPAQVAAVEASFQTAWFGGSVPAGFTIGNYGGSGVGLSTATDAVNLFDAGGVLQANVSFNASTTVTPFRTFDNTAGLTGLISTLSTAGTNGAFNAANPTAGTVQVGSPGTIANSGGPTTTAGPTTTGAPTTTGVATTTTAGPVYLPWPGDPTVVTRDPAATFTSNLSGLDYEPSGSTAPGVLWGVVNGPGSLYRMVFDGVATWQPDTANNWGAGKSLRYPNGSGDPDSEGVTYVGDSTSIDGIYVSTERDNTNSGVSRKSVLRYDPTAAGSTLTATNEWSLTGDIPSSPNDANLGLEGITWVQDSFLTAQGFFDDAKGHLYNPADYPNHGTGLFFVGVEATGNIFVYALSPDNTFARVSSFTSGFSQIMDLQFDRDLNDFWAVCDNGCNGRMHVLRINPSGHFEVALRYERPATMPNTNNEGFAIAPATLCVGGFKPAFWSDDNDINGFSLRSSTLPCALQNVIPPVDVPEFPFVVLAGATSAVLLGGWLVARRRPAVRLV